MEVIEKLQSEGHAIQPGTIGENLTIRGLDWRRIAPGDRLRIGSALIEVTRFTTPCTNIASAFKDRDFTRVLHQRNPGESRIYAKVLEPGELAPGMEVEHLTDDG
jgi:MOSC domain-containing protein YiiM